MDERELVRLLAKRPELGIEKAMDMYGRAVNTICRSILGDGAFDLVDEAVSETFFKLWKNRKKIRVGEGASLKSYLYSIARKTSIDLLRKSKTEPVPMEEESWLFLEAGITVEEQVRERDVRSTLHQIIALLKEPDNKVFLCKYFLGMKNREIADKLGLNEKRVENILFRGKEKLRQALEERGITCYEEI